jgi:hypothetical protein
VAVALTGAAAAAAAPTPVTLPSPLTQLTREPPLEGGATSLSELHRRHRIDASTNVRVSVDATGAPFAAVAVQRLVVHMPGDYVFTIGAPLVSVSAAPGSQSAPGVRGAAILWEGFNPGTRTLAARAVLRRDVLPLLPLRIERDPASVTLVDQTGANGTALAADALAAPLEAALRRLRADAASGRTPGPVGALLTSQPRTVALRAAAPLDVSGTIGGRALHLRLGGGRPTTVTVRGSGPIVLDVRPVAVVTPVAPGLDGRGLLEQANRALLSLARVRQYESFLGNPDPTGRSETTYRYVTTARPRPNVAARAHGNANGTLHAFAWAAAALLALGIGLAVWARA